MDKILVGRDDDIQLIIKEFDKLLNGQMGIVSVAGPSGMGKTQLLDHTFRQINPKTHITTKFSQNTEYANNSIAVLLGQLIDHILMLPRDVLDEVIIKVNSPANDIALLTSICPQIKSLISTSKPSLSIDYDRHIYRVKNAIYKLIDISSQFLFPLIIHMDDLQWADQLSLETVRTLINKKQTLNILLALSFRQNDNMIKLQETFKHKTAFVELKPLERSDVNDYIRLSFNGEIEKAEELTSLIYGLTDGNPFYMKEIISILIENKTIEYAQAKGIWETKIPGNNNFMINTDIEITIREKVFKNENYDLLKIIYCLDGQADYDVLKLIDGSDERLLNSCLKKAIESNVIIKKMEHNGRVSIMFIHDIISKFVSSCLSTQQIQRIHYQIADKVFNDSTIGIENKNRFIISHLIRASRHHASAQAEQWIELLIDVGRQEKQKASLDAALRIFEFCFSIMPDSAGQNEILEVHLKLELAECLCLTKRYKESNEMIENLLKNENKDLLLTIKRKQLYLFHYQREHQKTIKAGIEILKHLKFGFGSYRLPLDLIISRLVYNKKKIKSLTELPDITDERANTILDTLTIMNASAAISDDKMTAPIGLSAALVSAKCGKSANSLVGYVSYAYVLYIVWKDLHKTTMLVNQILRMADTCRDATKSMVYFMIGAFLSHWAVSIDQTDDYLQKSVEYGELTGDFMFLGYAITTSLDTKSFAGKSLDHCLAYIEDCKDRYTEIEQYTTTYNLEAHAAHMRALKNDCDECDFDKIGRSYPKLTPFEKLTEQTLMLERLLLTEKLMMGYQLAKVMAPQLQSTKGLLCRINILFYSLLVRIGAHQQLERAEQRSNHKQISRLLAELEQWSYANKDNFYGTYCLAKAEYKAVINNQLNHLYDSAADHANNQGNLRLEALAYLLAARRNKDNAKLCGFYAGESARLHQILGAHYISQLIEQDYQLTSKDVQPITEVNQDRVSGSEFSWQDIYSRQSEGLNDDGKVELFLKIVIEAGIADYCCVIYEKTGKLYIKHQMNKAGSRNSFSDPVSITHINHLPHKILRYVVRTEKEASHSPHQHNSIFANDAYFAANPDIYSLCLPMINCAVLIGALYLENDKNPIDDKSQQMIRMQLPSIITSFACIKDKKINDLFTPVVVQTLLTRREMDIIRLLDQGLSNEKIGAELSISVSTIKKHISSMMTKLDADNRIMVLKKAKEMKLLL